GFAISVGAERVEFRAARPRGGPALPGRAPLVQTAQTGSLFCAFAGRLYYRCELHGRLNTEPCETSDRASDASTVLEIYRRAGPCGLESLEGDYAAAIWD